MRHFITFICGLLMTATIFAQDIDTTTVYTIDEINVVGFYRTDTKVGNVLDRDFIAKTNKGQEPSFIFKQYAKRILLFRYWFRIWILLFQNERNGSDKSKHVYGRYASQ